ncbi:amidase [Opitutaceae bacterium EW11]|nr:amidase [Opitutaceae bacterium EW11]
MASEIPPWSFGEWQALAAKNPADAGRELFRRLSVAFTPEQRRAVLLDPRSEADLVAAFERVANTIAPLAGVPYVLKDLFYTAHEPLRAGSVFPPGALPTQPRDSKLPHALRGFGAILAGKSQLHEFAYGLTGENPHFGHCEHPHFPDRTSGGSSSGSAAAVASGLVPFAAGTDTGGSIRVPAAFCGLYGYRTSAGHALIADAFPLARSYDTAGWFTRNPQDLLTLMRFLIARPATTDRSPRGCFADFGMLEMPAEPEVSSAVRSAMERCAFPADQDTQEQLRHAFTGCGGSYGVLQSIEAYEVHAPWLDVYRPLYDPAVWARIDRGRRWTPEQRQAAAVRQTIVRNTWASFFLTYDYLVLPIAPFPALRKSECTQENRERLLALNTPASLGGLPVLTVPVPLENGLSTGIQIVVNDPNSPVIPWVLKR